MYDIASVFIMKEKERERERQPMDRQGDSLCRVSILLYNTTAINHNLKKKRTGDRTCQ